LFHPREQLKRSPFIVIGLAEILLASLLVHFIPHVNSRLSIVWKRIDMAGLFRAISWV